MFVNFVLKKPDNFIILRYRRPFAPNRSAWMLVAPLKKSVNTRKLCVCVCYFFNVLVRLPLRLCFAPLVFPFDGFFHIFRKNREEARASTST